MISMFILKIYRRSYKCHKLSLSKGKWILSEQRVESWKFHLQNSHTVHLFQYLPREVLGFGRWLFYFYFCILSLSRAEILCMLTVNSKQQKNLIIYRTKWRAGMLERKREWRSIPNIPIHLPGTFNECLDMGQVNLDILQPHLKETQLTGSDWEWDYCFWWYYLWR